MNSSKMIMDNPGRHAGRQQGETMAVRTDGGKRKRQREGKEEQSEGGGGGGRCCCTAEF